MSSKIVKNNTSIVGMICLLIGLFLFFSCGSNDNDNSLEGGGTGKPANQYLLLQPSGWNTVKVSSRKNSFAFSVRIKVVGNDIDSDRKVRICAWSGEELDAYNNKEKTTYVILPSSLYTLTSTEIVFKQGETIRDVEIKFNPSRVFEEFTKTGKDYIIALKLESDEMQVRDRQGEIIVDISFDYPIVEFAASAVEVSVNRDWVSASISAMLDYKVDGVTMPNPWDFTCSWVVPANAKDLVTEYNKIYKTSYQLLPVANYDLGEGVSFKLGDVKAKGSIMIKREGMAVLNYLLPLQLGECSNEGVICSSEICYLKIGRTYTNPIITNTSVADSTVIRAQDGYFYLYATQTDKLWVPIYRSRDLVNWEYQKTAFRNATKPAIPGGGAFWAPEIRYINNKYVLYFSWAKWGDSSISYTAVATSDSPLGDFPDSKALLTNDEFGSNAIDQFYYEDGDKKYMFVGSFNGIYVTKLTDDGLSVKRDISGKPTLKKKVGGNAFEGANIYKRGDYYYLFASINNCCDGLNSRYKVVVGRSKHVLGPYVDKNGKDMLNNAWELVLEGDGQKWFGPGHNSRIIQDDEGTDWMIYHSYVKENGKVGGRLGMLDRVLWAEDGWPYIKNKVPSSSDLIPIFHD